MQFFGTRGPQESLAYQEPKLVYLGHIHMILLSCLIYVFLSLWTVSMHIHFPLFYAIYIYHQIHINQ